MGRREEYFRQRVQLSRLSLSDLEKLMGMLGKRRFDENDVSVENEFRMASSVYLQKTKSNTSLRFHLKNFLGALLFSFIIGMFILIKSNI